MGATKGLEMDGIVLTSRQWKELRVMERAAARQLNAR